MDNFKLEERLDRIEKLLVSNKNVLTFDEACEYAGFSRSFLYKLTSSNRIPFSKPNGKMLYFEKRKLEEWLLQNKHTSDSEIEKRALDYLFKKSR